MNRRRAACSHLRGGDHDDLAQQSADDALVAVLRKLGDFRGDSRFTTWAYKFALFEAGVKVRRARLAGTQGSPRAGELGAHLRAGPTPHQDAETTELLRALREAIERRS